MSCLAQTSPLSALAPSVGLSSLQLDGEMSHVHCHSMRRCAIWHVTPEGVQHLKQYCFGPASFRSVASGLSGSLKFFLASAEVRLQATSHRIVHRSALWAGPIGGLCLALQEHCGVYGALKLAVTAACTDIPHEPDHSTCMPHVQLWLAPWLFCDKFLVNPFKTHTAPAKCL